ncbi:hypothetical protein CYY_008871 [Polysphondylium violaceum]|uniref:Helicase ATP-binding domain-containing protein n=1 Tax=Polysphondylium violaceum TaxID=133409 RepID=A0A8J4UPW2_9MYCE|nr:hypothetical protein CYY_008871 [Polysphondylium violaceum]
MNKYEILFKGVRYYCTKSGPQNGVQSIIESKLVERFKPTFIQVLNESHMHSRGTDTHFKVVIVSDEFKDQRLVQQHRLVNQALSNELSNGVHALSIHTHTPENWESNSPIIPKSPGCRFATGLLPIVSSHLSDLNTEYERIDHREPIPELFENWDYSIKLPTEQELEQQQDIDIDQQDLDSSTTKTKKKKKTKKLKKKKLDDLDVPERVFDLQSTDLQPKTIDETLFKDINIKLHDYQIESVNFALSNHRGIIKCATGGGKTLILASFIKALGSEVPTVILVTKRSLITQIYNTLVNLKICEPGRVSMDFFQINTVTISTLQSVKKIQEHCLKAKVLLVDEVHEFSSPTAKKAFTFFDNAYSRFGFSATPFKSDDPVHNHTITSTFGTLLCDVTTEQLTKKNILSDALIHFYPINGPIVKLPRGTKYQSMENVVVSENEYLNESIVKLVESIPSGRIMILVKRLTHGDILSKMLPNAYWVKGDDNVETREHVIQQLRNSNEKKVVAIFSSIGYVGVDVRIHHLINASGGKDPNMTIQKLGRGLRKAEDKNQLDYHDFYFSEKVNKYLHEHSEARMTVLKKEGHPVYVENELIPLVK